VEQGVNFGGELVDVAGVDGRAIRTAADGNAARPGSQDQAARDKGLAKLLDVFWRGWAGAQMS
jgi:hypothetical protein